MKSKPFYSGPARLHSLSDCSSALRHLRNCIVCDGQLRGCDPGSTRLFCEICSALGDVSISVSFLEDSSESPENICHKSHCETGRSGICVAIVKHCESMIHFQFDLFRTDRNLRAEVREKLYLMWQRDIERYGRPKSEIHCTFGKTFSRFDVPVQAAPYWKSVVSELLSKSAALEKV